MRRGRLFHRSRLFATGLGLLVPLAADPACSRHSEPHPRQGASSSAEEVRIESDGLSLRAFVWRPPGEGPFAGLVYNHGSEREPSVEFLSELGSWFQAHGYVVLLPFRRGSGGSEGTYWRDAVGDVEGSGGQAAVIRQLEIDNDDVVSAIRWLKSRPYVDSARVSVAGCSFGGIHTLLAAEKPLSLRAAVDFAGGAMSWASSPLLQQRLVGAVDHATVPTFFVQAQNDFDTSPTEVLSKEMAVVGKPYRARIYPPHGATHREGHGHFCAHGMAEWGPDVLAFLQDPPK
jgi:dienelactone hydrolase